MRFRKRTRILIYEFVGLKYILDSHSCISSKIVVSGESCVCETLSLNSVRRHFQDSPNCTKALFVTCCTDVKAAPRSRYQLSIAANENFKSVLTTFCISLLCLSPQHFSFVRPGTTRRTMFDVVGIVWQSGCTFQTASHSTMNVWRA
jgi:hypothetical protein